MPKQPFKIGEPVWALMKGYPWWPGRVVTIEELVLDPGESIPQVNTDEQVVQFFNDCDRFRIIEAKKLRSFTNPRYEALNRNNHSYIAELKTAVVEAKEYVQKNGYGKCNADHSKHRKRKSDSSHRLRKKQKGNAGVEIGHSDDPYTSLERSLKKERRHQERDMRAVLRLSPLHDSSSPSQRPEQVCLDGPLTATSSRHPEHRRAPNATRPASHNRPRIMRGKDGQKNSAQTTAYVKPQPERAQAEQSKAGRPNAGHIPETSSKYQRLEPISNARNRPSHNRAPVMNTVKAQKFSKESTAQPHPQFERAQEVQSKTEQALGVDTIFGTVGKGSGGNYDEIAPSRSGSDHWIGPEYHNDNQTGGYEAANIQRPTKIEPTLVRAACIKSETPYVGDERGEMPRKDVATERHLVQGKASVTQRDVPGKYATKSNELQTLRIRQQPTSVIHNNENGLSNNQPIEQLGIRFAQESVASPIVQSRPDQATREAVNSTGKQTAEIGAMIIDKAAVAFGAPCGNESGQGSQVEGGAKQAYMSLSKEQAVTVIISRDQELELYREQLSRYRLELLKFHIERIEGLGEQGDMRQMAEELKKKCGPALGSAIEFLNSVAK